MGCEEVTTAPEVCFWMTRPCLDLPVQTGSRYRAGFLGMPPEQRNGAKPNNTCLALDDSVHSRNGPCGERVVKAKGVAYCKALLSDLHSC